VSVGAEVLGENFGFRISNSGFKLPVFGRNRARIL
jgi:hypothetical protein